MLHGGSLELTSYPAALQSNAAPPTTSTQVSAGINDAEEVAVIVTLLAPGEDVGTRVEGGVDGAGTFGAG
jgi:hypothetical protein